MRNDQSIDVIMPAGGRIAGPFAARAGTQIKALVEVGDRTLLQTALGAAAGMSRRGRIALVGPPVACGDLADLQVHETGSGPGNIFAALEALSAHQAPASRILILTTDLPFVTSEALDDFVRRTPPNSVAAAPVITRDAYLGAFPGNGPSTVFVPLYPEPVTLGSAILISSSALRGCRGLLESAFAARKSNIRMARLAGGRIALGLCTRRLRIEAIERRVSKILGGPALAVRDASPALAYDIDCLPDWELAVSMLQNQR